MKVISILFLVSVFSNVCSQTRIRVRYRFNADDSTKEVRFSKKILNNSKLFLIDDNNEYEIVRVSDYLYLGPLLDDSIKNKLKGKQEVIIRMQYKNRCYKSHFPNIFLHERGNLTIKYFRVRKFKSLRYRYFEKQVNYVGWGNRIGVSCVVRCNNKRKLKKWGLN